MTELKEIQEIIDGSGNSFHCKVLEYLRGKGWHSIVSPYYTDNLTSKPREIDLISEKAANFGRHHSGTHGTVNTKLLIECKYIPQKVVFWFDAKDINAAQKWVENNTPLKKLGAPINDHRLIEGNTKVAKLFGSKTKPNPENEVMYKALNQSLNAMVYHRQLGSIIPRDPKVKKVGSYMVHYPVIVCDSFDNFWAVDMCDQKNPQKIVENFQLEVNYAYVTGSGEQKNEYFLIDVVDFNKMELYLEELDRDSKLITHNL